MFAFARILSGLIFFLLGLLEIFRFKSVHERVVAHFQLLLESSKGFFHGLYTLLSGMTPLLIVIAFCCQIVIGCSLIFSYRIALFGKTALILWILWLALYYPFYLLDSSSASYMLMEFGFGLFQVCALIFCLSQKKRSIERQVE